MYPSTKIMHLILEGSDHTMLGLSMEKARVRTRKRFMYDARWSKHPKCRDMVCGEWRVNYNGSHGFRLSEKLKSLGRSLKVWYKGNSRNSKKMIDRLEGEIRAAFISKKIASKEVQLKERELKKAIKNEELFWRTKSRVQ